MHSETAWLCGWIKVLEFAIFINPDDATLTRGTFLAFGAIFTSKKDARGGAR